MSKVLITGAASGLGAAIGAALVSYGHKVIGYDITTGDDVRRPQRHIIERAMNNELDILINCAGINAQDWLSDMSESTWNEVMGVNAEGIWKMTQACLPMLIESKGTVLNITSNAAWMPMTCSLAYNASKGAAHIMTLQMARELTRKYGITVFGIAPNKLKGTGMSRDIEREVLRTRGWDAEYAQKYQLNALLTGKETNPKTLAAFIAYLLASKENHEQLSGCILPYGA